MRKAANYDMVLDFYSAQSDLMRRDLKGMRVSVLPFFTNLVECNTDLSQQREWDICAVGTSSPRRERIYGKLESLGYKLSPFKTTDLTSVMRKAKVTLNVHAQRCNIVEASRMVHALNTGSCFVTEPAYGFDEFAPDSCYYSAGYRGLVKMVRRLLDEPELIERTTRRAWEHMRGEYERKCRASWERILKIMSLQTNYWKQDIIGQQKASQEFIADESGRAT